MVSPRVARSRDPESSKPLSGRKERAKQFDRLFKSELSGRASKLDESDSNNIGEGYKSSRRSDGSYSRSNYTNKRKAYATLFAVATIASAVALGVITGGSVFGIIAIGATIFTGYSIIKGRWADWGKNGWTWKKDLPLLLALGATPLISHLAIVPPSGGSNWLASILAKIGGATPAQLTAVMTSFAVAMGIGIVEDSSKTGRRMEKENSNLRKEFIDQGGDLSKIGKNLRPAKLRALYRKKLDELQLKEKEGELEKEERELKAELARVKHSPSAGRKKDNGLSYTYLDAFESKFKGKSIEQRVAGLKQFKNSEAFKADEKKDNTDEPVTKPTVRSFGMQTDFLKPTPSSYASIPTPARKSPAPKSFPKTRIPGKPSAYLNLDELDSKRPKNKLDSLPKADKTKPSRPIAEVRRSLGLPSRDPRIEESARLAASVREKAEERAAKLPKPVQSLADISGSMEEFFERSL
ncbi:MAG: hypothetical protein K1000chlam1_00236 [Candidatus Anoxychlamydiales bacterium]|nr:hypothetical protein [Candidatus Anoxychlamydiales bacterium]